MADHTEVLTWRNYVVAAHNPLDSSLNENKIGTNSVDNGSHSLSRKKPLCP